MTPRAGEIKPAALPPFHPATTIRYLGDGQNFTIADATCGVAVFGATGSGKTSGTGRFLALGYLGSAAEMGGIVLCAKPTEKDQWLAWAKETGREKDVRVFDASGRERFNFLDWESAQSSEGGGLTINVVALLEEIITALDPGKASGGENAFWEDALHQKLTANVGLVQFAGYELGLPTLRDIARSAPVSREQTKDAAWQKESACWFFLETARMRCEASGDEDLKADYAECRSYWLDDFANLSEKTRSIITLMFTKLAQPFSSRPLRKLFSSDTTIKPEDTFDGKIIIVDLSTQEFRLAGRIAALVWKYCWQVAVMRRRPAPRGQYLRPVFCWADEAAENFLSRGDSAFQAVARASAGCSVYLAQNVSQYRKRLGDDDGFESFIANLQTKWFHQSTGPTCKWAAELLGERWESIAGINTSSSVPQMEDMGHTSSSGVSMSEQRRFLIEPSALTTLKRGGEAYNFEIEALLYKGGHIFSGGMPYKRMRFTQR